MIRGPIDASSLQTPPTRVDRALEATMAALLAFMPLAFGAVEAWSEMIAMGMAAIAAVLLIVKSFRREGGGFIGVWAYLPLALLVAVAALQLVPLPREVAGAISPNTVGTRSALLGDLPAAQAALDYATLSFYPPATRQMLRVILIGVVVFVVGVNHCRSEHQVRRALVWVAGVGTAVAVLAIAQDLSGTREIYWRYAIGKSALGGTFVNRNHFAQFMNLSIGAMLALVFIHLQARGRLPKGWTSRLTEEHQPLLALGCGIIVCAIALFLSGSRGGMLSLLAAFAVTAVVASMQKGLPGRAWLLVILGLGILGAVVYTSFDFVTQRLATLEDLKEAGGARWQMNVDVVERIIPQFPVAGIGLGAHEVVYPMYSRLPDAGLATHVENEYVQMMEEMGVAGVAIMALFLALIASAYVRLVRRPTRTVHAAAIGLGFGLIAVAVHSLSDFGQRIPANLAISMLFCALLVSLSRMRRHGRPMPVTASVERRPGLAEVAGATGSVLLLAALGWATVGAVRAANAEAHFRQALAIEKRLAAEGWSEASDEDLAELIGLSEVAVRNQPDDVHYRHWLNVYRWRAISREIDPETGNFVMDEEAVGFAARIAEEMHAARALCPTFGPIRSLAGQIELFVLGRDGGARHILEGHRLAPLDPTTTFVAARLEASAGRWEEALAKFRRSVELGHPVEEIIDAYVRELDNPRGGLAFGEGSSRALLYLARILDEMGGVEGAEVAEEARLRCIDALKQEIADGAEQDCIQKHAQLAELLFARQQHADAAAHFRAALGGDYGNVGWRLYLARCLAATGQVREAMREAKVCQRLRPESAAVTKLIEELSLRILQPGELAQ